MTIVAPDTGIENTREVTKLLMDRGRKLARNIHAYEGSYMQAEVVPARIEHGGRPGFIHPHLHGAMFLPAEGYEALEDQFGLDLGSGLHVGEFRPAEEIAATIRYGTKSPMLSLHFPDIDDFGAVYDQLFGQKMREWVN